MPVQIKGAGVGIIRSILTNVRSDVMNPYMLRLHDVLRCLDRYMLLPFCLSTRNPQGYFCKLIEVAIGSTMS